ELTTVASTFTAARFIDGEAISGKPLGLRIAAGNAPNLVDPTTGGWGKVLLDPINSTQTTTLANLNTLGSLLSAFFTVADDGARAAGGHARTPHRRRPGTVAALGPTGNPPYAFSAQPSLHPRGGSRRKAPFVPYLAWSPPDFVLSLCFAGGGVYANGRFMFDA